MALVVWYATTFGWTEIVFDSLLEKIFKDLDINAQFIRKCRYYNKGSKPTINPRNNGLTGVKFIDEVIATIENEIQYKNVFPDIFIVSDDVDCRLEFNSSEYKYNCLSLRTKIDELVNKISTYSNNTKVIFMFAAPEIESWFLADYKNTFLKEFKAFNINGLHAINRNILPLNELERSGKSYASNSCSIKLSDDCIGEYNTTSLYSKRIHGQKFLQQLNPNAVYCLSYFFRPAYDAIKHNRNFIP